MRRAALGLLLMLAVTDHLLALGKSETPPKVDLPAAPRAFSPDGDGVQDVLQIHVPFEAAPGRVGVSAALLVYGDVPPMEGTLLARAGRDVGPTGSLRSLLAPARRRRLDSPVELTWDGRSRDGALLPDGAYLFQIVVEDDRRAIAITPPARLVIDTAAPALPRPTAQYTVFSPDGDGIRDQLTVEHGTVGTPEGQAYAPIVAWEAAIESEGGVPVRRFRFGADLPATATIDGADEAGALLPDSRYRYVLTARDAAGNRGSAPPLEIVVDRAAGRVSLRGDGNLISPNGDGVLDRVELAVEVDEPDSVSSWRLVGDPLGAVLDSGSGAPPAVVTVTGRDDRGVALPDGTYLVTLRITYANGTGARSEPRFIRVDTTPPEARLRAMTLPEPSPDDRTIVFGGSGRRAVRIVAELDESDESAWSAVVTTPESVAGGGLVVALDELELPGADPSFLWDGTFAGRPLPEGEYALRLRAVDDAGNIGTTDELAVILSRHDGSATLTTSATTLSPNGDGRSDSLAFGVDYDPVDSIERVSLRVVNRDGDVVRARIAGSGFSRWEWLGRDESGATVPDGAYEAQLDVRWRNGAHARATSGPIVVDTTAPEIFELSTPHRLFSPNGDGDRDVLRVAQRTSQEEEWRGVVIGAGGGVVAEWRWRGAAGDIVWDGCDLAGRSVPDGEYVYLLESTDAGGNSASGRIPLVVDTVSIPVSRQPPRIGLAAEPQPFTPDGDGVDDTLRFAIAAGGPNALASWSLEIVDLFGVPVRSFGGDGAPPAERTWEGRSSTGALIDGATDYLATLTVTDTLGNAASTTIRVRVGLLVQRQDGLARIAFPNIHFAAESVDPLAVAPGEVRRNLDALRSLAEVLRRYPDREILVVGHAEAESDPTTLSMERAEQVRRALMILGVAAERLRAVGRGAAEPLVPLDDDGNVWKNRRVEFILIERSGA